MDKLLVIIVLALSLSGCTYVPNEGWMPNKKKTILSGEGSKPSGTIGSLKALVAGTRIKKLGTKTKISDNVDVYFRFGKQSRKPKSEFEDQGQSRGTHKGYNKSHPHFKIKLRF